MKIFNTTHKAFKIHASTFRLERDNEQIENAVSEHWLLTKFGKELLLLSFQSHNKKYTTFSYWIGDNRMNMTFKSKDLIPIKNETC